MTRVRTDNATDLLPDYPVNLIKRISLFGRSQLVKLTSARLSNGALEPAGRMVEAALEERPTIDR